VASLVRRARSVERQRGLGLQARRRNVRGAFASARASPTRVCLVDDVYTSGATAGAAASALRHGGARRVEVVTLARAVR
jgi:predicted amidophosphoribosyltransferase